MSWAATVIGKTTVMSKLAVRRVRIEATSIFLYKRHGKRVPDCSVCGVGRRDPSMGWTPPHPLIGI